MTEEEKKKAELEAKEKEEKEEKEKEEKQNKVEAVEERVSVSEKDVRSLLAEVKSKIETAAKSPKDLEEMVKSVMEKVAKEQAEQKQDAVRRGEYAGLDIDPGKEFKSRGKLSASYTFKHAITGNVPRRFAKKYGEELRELNDLSDELLIVSKVTGKHPKELKSWAEYQELAHDFSRKALVSTSSGSGDEYVPTNFSAEVVDRTRLELKVAALHDRIPMRSNPYTVPMEGTDPTATLASEATGNATESDRITASDAGTENVTFTAKKLAVRSVFSEEINEDSIVDILEYVRRKISQALANGIENATINGDTTGTHQDADVTSSSDVRKAWKGYRKLTRANGKTDAGGDALTAIDLRNCRKAMGVHGIKPSDLAWVVGVNTMHQMLANNDSNGFNDFRTLDKLGPNATILTGQIGVFDGIPVIASEFVRENLGASGVYDGTNVGRTAIHLVNRSRFWYGDRRSVTLKSFEDVQTDQQVLVIKQRLDFQPVQDATSNDLVGTVIDILVT